MNPLEEQLRQSIADVTLVGARFALVGGLAVSVRAEPRLTRDADLAVAVDNDREAEQLVFELQGLGYQIVAAVEQEATGRLSTIRLTLDGSGITDLLFASSGIEQEIVEAATPIVILPHLTVPVATIGHLIAMKLLARDDRGRPADADDLRALREVAAPTDWDTAAQAVGAIESRGFARGRALQQALVELKTNGAF